jgi:hypothetical protein
MARLGKVRQFSKVYEEHLHISGVTVMIFKKWSKSNDTPGANVMKLFLAVIYGFS